MRAGQGRNPALMLCATQFTRGFAAYLADESSAKVCSSCGFIAVTLLQMI
jgi:hypothetical protein